MRKIAFVMPWHISERGGGAEVQANYLGQELGKRGYEVSYVCQTIHHQKISTSERLGQMTIYWVKPSGRFPWLDQNKYLKPLKIIQPNYILQRISSNVIYVLGKYSARHQCKLVWFCTDNKNPIRNFHQFKFKEHAATKSLGFLKRLMFGLNSIIMDFYRVRGMKHVDIAFTQNEIQEAQVQKHFNLSSSRMISGHPIPNKSISATQRFDNKTILWCANWGTHKRPQLYIDLARQMSHTDFNFVMVGGHSDQQYVNRLLSNKPDNLTVTGSLSFDDALRYFDSASVFVNTSTPGGDGFPNTFIQAWLRHTPIVSLGFDPDHVVEKNKLGYNLNSVDAAAEHIGRLMNDFDLYKSLSNNAYHYACQNHTINVMTDHFLKVLEQNENRNVT